MMFSYQACNRGAVVWQALLLTSTTLASVVLAAKGQGAGGTLAWWGNPWKWQGSCNQHTWTPAVLPPRRFGAKLPSEVPPRHQPRAPQSPHTRATHLDRVANDPRGLRNIRHAAAHGHAALCSSEPNNTHVCRQHRLCCQEWAS